MADVIRHAHPGPTTPALGVVGHMAREVKCSCGWIGKISDLRHGVPKPEALNFGPDFPVCPSCMTEKVA
jgi:hypothetical protein